MTEFSHHYSKEPGRTLEDIVNDNEANLVHDRAAMPEPTQQTDEPLSLSAEIDYNPYSDPYGWSWLNEL